MAKLSLNKAAKYAGKSKAVILERLNSNDLEQKLSGEKNEKGHWQIDTAELDRVFPKTDPDQSKELVEYQSPNPEKSNPTSNLEGEVKTLREMIAKMEASHDRERQTLVDQIDDLRATAERQSADHRQALAMLSDQREKPQERRGWSLFRRKAG